MTYFVASMWTSQNKFQCSHKLMQKVLKIRVKSLHDVKFDASGWVTRASMTMRKLWGIIRHGYTLLLLVKLMLFMYVRYIASIICPYFQAKTFCEYFLVSNTVQREIWCKLAPSNLFDLPPRVMYLVIYLKALQGDS